MLASESWLIMSDHSSQTTVVVFWPKSPHMSPKFAQSIGESMNGVI